MLKVKLILTVPSLYHFSIPNYFTMSTILLSSPYDLTCILKSEILQKREKQDKKTTL